MENFIEKKKNSNFQNSPNWAPNPPGQAGSDKRPAKWWGKFLTFFLCQNNVAEYFFRLWLTLDTWESSLFIPCCFSRRKVCICQNRRIWRVISRVRNFTSALIVYEHFNPKNSLESRTKVPSVRWPEFSTAQLSLLFSEVSIFWIIYQHLWWNHPRDHNNHEFAKRDFSFFLPHHSRL